MSTTRQLIRTSLSVLHKSLKYGLLSALLGASAFALYMTGSCSKNDSPTDPIQLTVIDTIPPTVVSITPADACSGVDCRSNISAIFSEPIDASTVSPSSFKVIGVTGSVYCSDSTATYVPNSQLAFGTTFTVAITTDIADKAGNNLTEPFYSSFSTLIPETTLVADAGDDFDVNMGENAMLSGAGSYDPDQQPFTYAWTQVSGPQVTLSNATTVEPHFTAPEMVATLEFELMITNGTEIGLDHVFVTVLEDKSNAVFISKRYGNDSYAGTREAPMKTIGAALDKFAGSGADMYVANETYAEYVVLRNGISIYGGFTNDDTPVWQRDLTSWGTIIRGDSTTVIGPNVTSLTLDGVKIESTAGYYPCGSSIAVILSNSADITLSRISILAGVGSRGIDRVGRTDKPSKASGGNRGTDACAWCAICDGGDGGSSPGRAGGRGGNGGSTISDGGSPGPDGGGCGGAGRTFDQYLAGGAGCDGPEHSSTSRGDDGLGGNSIGSIIAGVYAPSNGQNGSTGDYGYGGGGGGGGSGGGGTCGGGGGGGGAGGYGGYGGYAGTGGGASIGILLINGSDVNIHECTVSVQLGGRGGNGGFGGAGGDGGDYGSGGSGYVDWAGIRWSYSGGRGGYGSAGQIGGCGGGGGGGPSICLLLDATSTADVTGDDDWNWPAQGAAGGIGGDETGNRGATGMCARNYKLQ